MDLVDGDEHEPDDDIGIFFEAPIANQYFNLRNAGKLRIQREKKGEVRKGLL